MYFCLGSFIPIIISLILTPMFSFMLSLMIFVITPVYFIIMLITLKYIRKDIIAHSFRLGRMTARTGLIYQATIPILVLLLLPVYGILWFEDGFVFTGLDYIVFILWGASSIINFIAAILFKRPIKKQSTF